MTSCRTYYPDLYRQFSQRSTLFSDYPDRLNCTLCHKIMIEPKQTLCGCRFCFHCIENHFQNGGMQCPNCEDYNFEHNRLLEDKAVEREILNLEMMCLNKGCNNSLTLRDLAVHLSDCEQRNEQCALCKQWFKVTKINDHVANQCNKGVITCGDCGEEMTREDFAGKHRDYKTDPANVCSVWIRNCPYRCDEEKLVAMRIHLRQCPNKPSQCSFNEIGCHFTGSPRELKLHSTRSKADHDSLMLAQLQVLTNENAALTRKLAEQEMAFKTSIEQLQEINSTSSDTIRKLTVTLDQMEVTQKSLFANLKAGSSDSCKDLTVSNRTATWTIADIREKIKASMSGDNNHNTLIASDPFYVIRPGYNISLKIYPSGDGKAFRKYLSVYFVINKGEYDDEMSWPFQCKVRLTLLSSDPTRGDIIVNMRPDTNPGCYGRPLDIQNVGAGQPAFVRISEIINGDHFLHNGALKIQLSIL